MEPITFVKKDSSMEVIVRFHKHPKMSEMDLESGKTRVDKVVRALPEVLMGCIMPGLGGKTVANRIMEIAHTMSMAAIFTLKVQIGKLELVGRKDEADRLRKILSDAMKEADIILDEKEGGNAG